MRISRYRTEYRCSSCGRELTNTQVCYSSGRCPLCGVKADSAGTLVERSEHAYRLVSPPWWKFWAKPYRYYGIKWPVAGQSFQPSDRSRP